jgi:hypothetical protein
MPTLKIEVSQEEAEAVSNLAAVSSLKPSIDKIEATVETINGPRLRPG